MDAKKLNQELYDKMAAEQKEYRSWLLEQTPEEILNHAYEYATREDILIEAETVDLPQWQAEALLKLPSPLADIYKDFCDMETDHMRDICMCIEGRADDLVAELWKTARNIPLYQMSSQPQMDYGERNLCLASHKANIACRDAIDSAIQEGFDGMHLTADAKGVLAEFGSERVAYVLAATLQDKTWDQRFSANNQKWASAVPMAEPQEQRRAYAIKSHPALLDGFTGMIRKEIAAMREQPEQVRKPSIKAQLAAKPVPSDQPTTKPKEREVR